MTTRRRRLVAPGAVVVVAAGAILVGGIARDAGGCLPDAPTGQSAARRWDEATLEAIRADLPAPTVHARNLFHVSLAMWDAWAAYDDSAAGVMSNEKVTPPRGVIVRAARTEALSYAAYRVLRERFAESIGAEVSLAGFDRLIDDLCLPRDVTTTRGTSPAAVGNRIAASVLAAGRSDGASREGGYEPVNPPLVVAEPGTEMHDPNRWQPLQLERMISQNGIPVRDGVQRFIGPHWGNVSPFAIPETTSGVPIDPGAPPQLGDPKTDADFKAQAIEVIHLSSQLDPADDATVDISPGAVGDNRLGADDGRGHATNSVTGEPYEPNRLRRGDFARVVAQFWADGPRSETPPGHWNVIANLASDDPALERRIGGTGPVVDRLEWDVKLYLALNGALHDAAIAAWGTKGHYDSARPISMVRHLGGLGQSSDPTGPAYHPDGLPLVPGLVEVVTPASSAPGERHAGLREHVGAVAVRAWAGNPPDPERDTGGVEWIRAVDWVPYQLETFVTPAFAGYVSGHSTFSRAGSEVLTAFTASTFFPGGLGEVTVPKGSLEIERGPGADVTLQWATYADAADQAGRSRLYGGIHIRADDHAGRVIGAQCGQAAWARARQHFDGESDPR